jgi:signal peptidase I
VDTDLDNQHQEPRRKRWLRALFGHKAGLVAILVLCVVFGDLFIFRGMRFFLVPSGSMEPTLLRGDYIVTLSERTYRPGNIVVVFDLSTNDYLVKRIVAVGDDHVEVRDGALFVNDAYASEPYILEPMMYGVEPPIAVPPGHVLLLGDNRNESDDAHISKQSTSIDDIIGRVRFIYNPYSRFGPVRAYPIHTVPAK